MQRPKRDAAWAWVALSLAILAAMIAAPWDNAVRDIRVDGSLGGDVLAGGTSDGGATGGDTDGATGDGSTDSASTGGDTGGDTGDTAGTSDTTGGSTSSTSGSSTGRSSSSTGGSSSSTGGSSSTGSSGGSSGGNSDGSTSTGSTGAIVKGEQGKGVTDKVVRIGFLILEGQDESSAALGISALSDPGDNSLQIEELTKWVNGNGGIGGRQMEAYKFSVDMQQSTSDDEQRGCTKLSDTDDVFAVILIGQIREATRQCYADKGVITLDPSGFPMSEELYQQAAPYLWSPSFPTLNETSRVLPQALFDLDFFEPDLVDSPDYTDPCQVKPCRLGLMMYDFPNYEKIRAEIFAPAFEKLGNPIVSTVKVDASSADTIVAGLGNGVVTFQANRVTRVVFLGGSPLGPFFMVTANSQKYNPIYGTTSFDNPRFATQEDQIAPDQAWGMRGIGFAPALDVIDENGPAYNAMEKQCSKIYNDVGITFADRGEARVAWAYCESVLMIRDVAGSIAPNLTAKRWAIKAETLGGGFQSANAFKTEFSTAHRAGSRGYYRFTVPDACYCTMYQGSQRNLW